MDLRREIKIHFLNEICQDAGGLVREWFSVLIEELFDSKFHLFVNANKRSDVSYLINEYSGEYNKNHLDYYYFCGQVIAKALYEQIPIKSYLNKIILKQLLEQPLNAKEDLKYVDGELYNSINYILSTQLTNAITIGTFTITKRHPITKSETSVDLKENGSQIQIDESNKEEFAKLFFEATFITNTKSQTEALINGFTSLIPRTIIEVLDPEELEYFICGEPTLDVADWKENTLYGAPYSETHPVIILFWKMVENMSTSEREKLLQFCTGSRRVPVEGFRGLRAANSQIRSFRIEARTSGEKGVALMVAHTCFNKLELPMYHDSKIMEECVKKVLESPSYFQFTFE